MLGWVQAYNVVVVAETNRQNEIDEKRYNLEGL